MICADGNNNNNNTWNITHNTESTAARTFKYERRGSPGVQRGQVPGRKGMTQETTTKTTHNNKYNNTQDREVLGNRPDIIIKNKKKKHAC